MKNVDMKLDGSILTIKVDISKDFGESKSGKSITIASTEGNISIPASTSTGRNKILNRIFLLFSNYLNY